jgi:hypothetical protein
MSTDRTQPPVAAFMLVETTPEWLAMSVAERVEADVVDLLVGTENGYASTYDVDTVDTLAT